MIYQIPSPTLKMSFIEYQACFLTFSTSRHFEFRPSLHFEDQKLYLIAEVCNDWFLKRNVFEKLI